MIKFKLFSKERFEGKSDEEILDMREEKKINPNKVTRNTAGAIGGAVGAVGGALSGLNDPKLSQRGLVGNLVHVGGRAAAGGVLGSMTGSFVGRVANSGVSGTAKRSAKAVHKLEEVERELKYSDVADEEMLSEETPKKEEFIDKAKRVGKKLVKSPLARTAAAAGVGALAGRYIADSKKAREKDIQSYANEKSLFGNYKHTQEEVDEHAAEVNPEKGRGSRFAKGAAVGGLLAGTSMLAYQTHKKNQAINERNKELIDAKRAARRRQWDKEE